MTSLVVAQSGALVVAQLGAPESVRPLRPLLSPSSMFHAACWRCRETYDPLGRCPPRCRCPPALQIGPRARARMSFAVRHLLGTLAVGGAEDSSHHRSASFWSDLDERWVECTQGCGRLQPFGAASACVPDPNRSEPSTREGRASVTSAAGPLSAASARYLPLAILTLGR